MLHSDVKAAVDSGNIGTLKYIFCDCLDGDPTFDEYLEDYAYCKAHGVLFEPHIELHTMSCANVNEEYWIQLKKDFMKNPSIKRLEHMREVAKILYKERIEKINQEKIQKAKAASAQKAASTKAPDTSKKTDAQIPVQHPIPPVSQEVKPVAPIHDPADEGIRRASEPIRRREPVASSHPQGTPPKKANGVSCAVIAVVAIIAIVLIIIMISKLFDQ